MDFSEAWDDTCSNMGLACRNGDSATVKQLLKRKKPVDLQDNRGFRPIHEAVYHNRIKCVKLLIKHGGTDVNWRTFEGETPLLIAARLGLHDIVCILLTCQADANIGNNEEESPLILAAKIDNLNCVKTLVEAGARVNHQDYSGWTALHASVRNKSVEMILYLLDNGAELDVKDDCDITPVFVAAQTGSTECLQILVNRALKEGKQELIDLEAEDKATPLMIAAQYGSLDCVQLLLQHGADPNKRTSDNVMALHLAVQHGHLGCVKMLLEKTDTDALLFCSLNSLQPDSRWQTLDKPLKPEKDDRSVSPLHLAVEYKRIQVLQYLLDSGLDCNAFLQDLEPYCADIDFFGELYGNYHHCGVKNPQFITALGVAIFMNDVNSVTMILDAGSDVNPKSLDVIAPLAIAAMEGYTDIIELLLSRGADPNYPRRIFPGVCPLPLIAGTIDPASLQLLLKSGGDARLCCPRYTGKCISPLDYFFSYPSRCRMRYIYYGIAIYQEFLGERFKSDDISRFYEKWMTIYASTPEKHLWKRALEVAENPRSLSKMCRLKIREAVIDAKNYPLDLPSHLRSLPLPESLLNWICFEQM